MNTQKAISVLCSAAVGILFFVAVNELLQRVFEEPYSDAYYYSDTATIQTSYKSIPMFECSWCHRTKKLNRHHVMQQKYYPELRDDPTNIVVLCRDCHFVLGHRCNWDTYNPDVVTICNTYTNTFARRMENENVPDTNN